MATIGIFTNKGIEKTLLAAGDAGFFIYPSKFRVCETKTPTLDPTIGDIIPLQPHWYEAPISSAEKTASNTITVICTVPPGQITPSLYKDIKEIYLYAKDWNNVEFLLAVGQPDITVTYEDAGSVKLRLALKLDNINLSGIYSFIYTQANEINDHNSNPAAHGPLFDQLGKLGGVYINPSDHKYVGQPYDLLANFLGLPEVTDVTCVADVAGSLNSKYFYLNTPTGGYYVWYSVAGGGVDPAIIGRTGIKVDLVPNETATNVANKTAVKLATYTALFYSTNLAAVATVTNVANGPSTDASAQTSGFTINVTQQGVYDGSITYGKIVYKDPVGIYRVADATDVSKLPVAGFADTNRNIMVSSGLIEYTHSYPQGTKLYLSVTTPGQITDDPISQIKLGYAYDNDLIYLTLIEQEIERYYGQLRLIPMAPNSKRVRITSSSAQLLSRISLIQELRERLFEFEGAQIDFDTGTIYEADGVTVLDTFTPASLTTGQYTWYSVQIRPGLPNANETISGEVKVIAGGSPNAVLTTAKRALFANGCNPLGQVWVKKGATNIDDISGTNIYQIGVGAAAGISGEVPNYIQESPSGTIDGVNDTFVLSQNSLNDFSLYVYVDGTIIPKNEWSLTGGNNLVFNAGSIPAPGQEIWVKYVTEDNDIYSGYQETPSGVVNGVNDTFTLAGTPPNLASLNLYINGLIIPQPAYQLTLGPGVASTIKITDPLFIPVGGQSLYVTYPVKAASVGTAPVSGFTVLGTPGSPYVVNPAVSIPTNSDPFRLIFLKGQPAGGAQNMTATPLIQAGSVIGQVLKLKGAHATDYPVLSGIGSGVSLNGNWNGSEDNTLTLTWNGILWDEDSRR